MDCKHCGRSMLALFTSYVCESCDSRGGVEIQYIAYTVWYDRGQSYDIEYIFPTRVDANRYRAHCSRQSHSIREVNCSFEPKWVSAVAGSLVASDRLYHVYADRNRCVSSKYRVWLA